jgi:hypothetical protein
MCHPMSKDTPSAFENATAQFHLMASENSAVVAIDSMNFGGVDY